MSSTGLKSVYGKPKVNAKTPVSVKIDESQVLNSAGGYAFNVTDEALLRRFLITGTEGGTYYATEQKLTKDSANRTLSMIKSKNGKRVVDLVVEVSVNGLAVKNDTALFVLAMASSFGNDETRAYALSNLNKVARIPTHLFMYCEFVNSMRGWGRGLKNAVASWYTEKDAKDLAFHIVKYRSREGWSHRDVLRLAHPKADGTTNEVLNYAVNGWESVGDVPHENDALKVIWASEKMKTASDKEVIDLITTYRLPFEVVPTEKRNKQVYESMIPHAGLTWLLRNLNNLTRTGAIAEGQYSNLNMVIDRLTNADNLKKARVHPLSVLVALRTYSSGHGVKGNSTWTPIGKVVDGLNDAFKSSFHYAEPSGKRFTFGLDVSGSMSCAASGLTGINCREASACVALASVCAEKNVQTMAFATDFQRLHISKTDSFDSVVRKMSPLSFGGTDCSLPMSWAEKNNIETDAFVIFTDNETWNGAHAVNTLASYRKKSGINAKLIVAAMAMNNFTIADPKDPYSLDIAGFSADTPAVISEFAKL